MELPLYIVDAFTTNPFGGNPAAVCPLETWLDDDLMQDIAAENNLSETAFFVKAGDSYELRWFTPKVEVALCGHATLATAFVLSQEPATAADNYRFTTQSGELGVKQEDDWFTLDFPARPLEDTDNTAALASQVEATCGIHPQKVTLSAGNCLAEFENETIVRSVTPDPAKVLALDCKGLIITARGDDCDFVSRFFAPRVGINEDPVTGSIHCSLIPYWHRITGKPDMFARQVSARGGELRCHFAGDRVGIGGQAVLFSRGRIFL
jgi:PhzF family phenazine biosynthesis protein